MISIIDYGLGNVQAIANVYNKLGLQASIVSKAKDLINTDKVILPGVGTFDKAMQRLEKSGFRNVLDEIVIEKKVPILGICVGMQMLARSSEEGDMNGLGWINADVKRFDFSSMEAPVCIPHMGWNNIKIVEESPLLKHLDENTRFYFLHSYYISCRKRENVIAVTKYGAKFTCAVNADNVYGVQFHPEKSHGSGVRLLKNFAEVE